MRVRSLSLFLFACLYVSATSAEAQKAIGSVAPPLHFDKVLQAPRGASTDWTRLRGKTVVLEFWATWCAPCVEAIPHLRELVASVDPQKVVFISVDDEDPKVIETFVTRKQMAGWVAVDQSGATFKAYGVGSRPTTIVVDGSGRIAAITNPQLLNAEQLLRWADAKGAAKQVRLHAAKAMVEAAAPVSKLPSPAPAPQTPHSVNLLDINLRRVPKTDESSFTHGDDFWAFSNIDSSALWKLVYALPRRRFRFVEPLPSDNLSVKVWHPGIDERVIRPLLEAALAHELHVQVSETDVSQDAFLLKSTVESKQRLHLPASPFTPQQARIADGHLVAFNSTLDQIASALEDYLDHPVLNETGIEGLYDVDMQLPSKEIKPVREALQSSLGLALTSEKRNVPTFVVSPDSLSLAP